LKILRRRKRGEKSGKKGGIPKQGEREGGKKKGIPKKKEYIK